MSEKLRIGDRVIDGADRVGRVERVNDDGSIVVDMTSQYWDTNDKVVSHTFSSQVKKLKD